MTTAGAPDTGYSGDGHSPSTMNRHRYGELQDLALAPDGSIVGVGTRESSEDVVVVARPPAGAPAPGFGTGGQVVLPKVAPSDIVVVDAVHVLPDGRIAVLYQRITEASDDLEPSQLAVLTTAGALDPTFGGGDGIADVGIEVTEQAYWAQAVSLTSSGSGGTLALHVSGPLGGSEDADPDIFVQKVSLTGVIAATYGADGTSDGWVGARLQGDRRTAGRRSSQAPPTARSPSSPRPRTAAPERRAWRSDGSSPPAPRTPGSAPAASVRCRPGPAPTHPSTSPAAPAVAWTSLGSALLPAPQPRWPSGSRPLAGWTRPSRVTAWRRSPPPAGGGHPGRCAAGRPAALPRHERRRDDDAPPTHRDRAHRTRRSARGAFDRPPTSRASTRRCPPPSSRRLVEPWSARPAQRPPPESSRAPTSSW